MGIFQSITLKYSMHFRTVFFNHKTNLDMYGTFVMMTGLHTCYLWLMFIDAHQVSLFSSLRHAATVS
jgi:hypothetical protein